MSLLNPYAAPFIPLSRQRTDNENTAPITSENSKIDDATAQYKEVGETTATKIIFGDFERSDENPQHQLPNNTKLKFNNSVIEGPLDYGESLGEDCNIHCFEGSMPHKANDETEKQSPIEDYELDLAYLAAAFPGISEQSLIDMYCANAGDLEASVYMLIQLEDDDLLRLPHTLNFLDISESGTWHDDSPRIQKTTAHNEASGSSHPSNSASGSKLQ